MLRRRELLTQEVASNLDTWLQFPLYFDFDSDVNGSPWVTYLTRAPDDTSKELSLFLTNYLIENCFVKINEISYSYYELNNPSDIGIEIYFKNLKVIQISLHSDEGSIKFTLNGTYKINWFGDTIDIDYVFLMKNGHGEIYLEY